MEQPLACVTCCWEQVSKFCQGAKRTPPAVLWFPLVSSTAGMGVANWTRHAACPQVQRTQSRVSESCQLHSATSFRADALVNCTWVEAPRPGGLSPIKSTPHHPLGGPQLLCVRVKLFFNSLFWKLFEAPFYLLLMVG